MWRSRLRELVNRKGERDRRAYTQKEIAEAVDLRQPTVSVWMNYETRFHRIDGEVAAKFARWLEVTPTELFEYVEEDNPELVGAGAR